jgi:hypothetical protein
MMGGASGVCREGKCSHCDWLREVATLPTGVRICRKGAVEKWLPNQSGTYDKEHVESVKLAGGTVGLCPDIYYKNLRLPN